MNLGTGTERHRHRGTAAPVILDSPWPRVDQNDQMANGPISILSDLSDLYLDLD